MLRFLPSCKHQHSMKTLKWIIQLAQRLSSAFDASRHVAQALRLRRAYVKSILRQDVGWFDEHPAGQLPTAVTANMAKVQDGLGRKVGDIIMNALSGTLCVSQIRKLTCSREQTRCSSKC